MMSTARIVKNLAGGVAAIVAVLALFGYVYTFGSELTNIHNQIDRNCRFLAIVEADTRYLIIQHTTSAREAKAFRTIFADAIHDSCG